MARSPLPTIPTPLVDLEVTNAPRRATPTAILVSVDDAEKHREPGVSFTGKAGEVRALPESNGNPRWLAGLGDPSDGRFRAAGAALIREIDAWLAAADGRPSRTIQLRLDAGADPEQLGELAIGVLLGGYRFTVTTEPAPPKARTIRLILPAPTEEHHAAVRTATELARAGALARDLANAPSNIKDPAWLAGTARRVTEGLPSVSCAVYDEKWLAANGFGGVLAVGSGSARPPRLIELTYRPRGARGHLLYVGKGITFDTGGLSVKPADGMHLMRTDMAGGAAVIGALRSIAALRLPVRVTALVPAAENHVSGSAYRPGDVVRHYGGKTTEVANTDAEGRMVLADAMAYGIRRFRPDALVDVATLTGAMKVALGTRTGGFFASADELATRLLAAGERAGERWWRMPLLDAHADAIAGELADVRQAPPGPGAIIAALFLREFTEGLPWAHLDIAGPARADTRYDEVVPGATGFAARTLVELAAGYR